MSGTRTSEAARSQDSNELGVSIPISPIMLTTMRSELSILFADELRRGQPFKSTRFTDVRPTCNALSGDKSQLEYDDRWPRLVGQCIEYVKSNLSMPPGISASVSLAYYGRQCGTILQQSEGSPSIRLLFNLSHGEVFHSIGTIDGNPDRKEGNTSSDVLSRSPIHSTYVDADHVLVVREGVTDAIIVKRSPKFKISENRSTIRPRKYTRYLVALDLYAPPSLDPIMKLAENPSASMKRMAMRTLGASSSLGTPGGSNGRNLLRFRDIDQSSSLAISPLPSSTDANQGEPTGEEVDVVEQIRQMYTTIKT